MKAFIRDVSENDALPLESEWKNGDSFRQCDLSDFMDNSFFTRIISPKESGFKEKVFNLFGSKVRCAQ